MKRKRILTAVLLLLAVIAADGKARKAYNVRDFGAKGDGKALDSPAIDRAIRAASEAGGGTVWIPAGTYVCGTIHLLSDIHLYLDPGCTLLASQDNPAVYDPEEDVPADAIYQDTGHTYFQNSLIWGRGLRNVSITGKGLIDGEGLVKKGKAPGAGKLGLANKAVCLVECQDVTIRDVTFFRGGHFAILLTGCNLVTLDNLTIDTNRDGIDIDCCTNVVVSNCRVNAPFDDAICPKSSFALGRKIVTENVTITNCQVSSFKMGTLLDGTMQPHPYRTPYSRSGRIKFGTESNGGFRNCAVSNCTFHSCKGFALEQVDGGVLENITVSNLTMYNARDYAIYIQLGERLRDPDKTSPSVGRNIIISNVVAHVADSLAGIFISGTPRFKLENVKLSDITVITGGGASAEAAETDFQEIGDRYPEPATFKQILPAYGVFARHVNGLYLDNVSVSTRKPDFRPALRAQDVHGFSLDRFRATTAGGVPPTVFEDVTESDVTP